MPNLSLEEPLLEVKLQPKKILIAIDLEEYSEQIIAYSLLISQRLYCEYTVLYCQQNNVSKKYASQKISALADVIHQKYAYLSNHLFNSLIVDNEPSIAIHELNQIHNYNCIMIGTSNKVDTWEMGSTSKAILLKLYTNIVVIPPKAEIAFPNSLCILIEKQNTSKVELLTGLNEFISQDNIFVNLVLFAANKKILEEEKSLIEKYQDFFESNFTFTFIIEAVQTYMNFFNYIEETYCSAAVITLEESSVFYESLLKDNFAHFPCSPKIPVLYIKRK